MNKWQLVHSDGEFADVDDDTSSISSDWSVMNFHDDEEPECSLTVDDPQSSSSSSATTPTDANPSSILPQVLSSHRRHNRHGRRRGRAVTARHSEAPPVATRAVSDTVRQALAPAADAHRSIAVVNAKVSNQAALLAHMHLERRYLRRGGDCTPKAQQDRKHAKWLNGQARIGHAHQRTKAREV